MNPRFILDFDSITNDYVSGDFLSRNTTTQKLFLNLLRMVLTEIVPTKPTIILFGDMEATIQDNSNEITTLIKDSVMLGRAVDLKGGFEEIAEADFATLFKGRVVDYPLTDDLVAYNFRIKSSFSDLDKLAFTGISQQPLNGQMAAAEVSTTLSQNRNAGANVFARLTAGGAGLETGDMFHFDDGGGNEEVVAIESTRIDQGTGLVEIQVTLANNYLAGDAVDNLKHPIDDVTDFYNAVPVNPPFDSGLYILAGNEIIKYTSKDAGNNWLLLTAGGRIRFSSPGGRHSDDSIVKECWAIKDDPITLMLNIITTTVGGANGDFDLGIADFGVGMDDSLIDFAAFESIQNQYFLSDTMQFFLTEPMKAKDIIKDIATACGCYFVVSNGLFSLRKVLAITPSDSQASLTDADLLLPSESSWRWIPSPDQLINEVEFQFDWLPGQNKYTSSRLFELVNSKTTYNITKRLVIKSKGVRAGALTTYQDDYLVVLAQRYGNPPPRIEANLKWKHNLLEAGDVVDLTSTILPDLTVGDRTLSAELVELVKAELQPFNKGVAIAGYMYFQEDAVAILTSDSDTPSDGSAVFNATDSVLVQGDDATYDNSANLNISGTRLIVKIRITLVTDAAGAKQSIKYHMRIGKTVDAANITAIEADDDFTFGWQPGVYGELHNFVNTHTFDGLTDDVWDVKVDFHTRTGTDAANIASIGFIEVTVESDGTAYVEIT